MEFDVNTDPSTTRLRLRRGFGQVPHKLDKMWLG